MPTHCEILGPIKVSLRWMPNYNANVPVSRQTDAISVTQMYCEWDICISIWHPSETHFRTFALLFGIHQRLTLMGRFSG